MTPVTPHGGGAHTADLVSRLQMAFGPDRGLDCDIFVATAESPFVSYYPDCVLATLGGFVARLEVSDIQSFTGSVDHALALLPPDCDWLIGRGQTVPDEPPYGAQVFNASSGRMVEMPPPIAESEHPVLAIAICIAALKARAAIAKAVTP